MKVENSISTLISDGRSVLLAFIQINPGGDWRIKDSKTGTAYGENGRIYHVTYTGVWRIKFCYL